ncbi:MAG TPA: hypothetical protein VFA11_03785 [Acidimicrobiales bacterium]|nr:hypothetical protein [Acidimicrobiales bacterium]
MVRKLLVAAGAVATAGGLAWPAGATTTATITLTAGGSLSVDAPGGSAAIDLGSAPSGYESWTTGGLGTVSVVDTRTGLLNDDWTATASVSDFVLQGPVPAGASAAQETIPAWAMSYGLTAVSSTASFTGAGGPVVAHQVTAGSMIANGPNRASWDPTLTITLDGQLAGTYEGTITHSAA